MTTTEQVQFETGSGGRKTVVVGVDGSPCSRAALGEAMRSATRRGDPLRVIMVLEPIEWMGAWGYGPAAGIALPDRAEVQQEVLRSVEQMVAEVREEQGDEVGDLEIDAEALPGRPADVLVDAARDADELVVGHRGRGSVASTLLGSVGMGCVLHAPCAVTVIPVPQDG